jgi:hypothetical protein
MVARTRLRQLIQKREAKPFSGKSGKHQCFIHLQTGFRLGLVAKAGSEESRAYIGDNKVAPSPSDYLLAELGGVKELEDAVREQKWINFASRIFAPSPVPSTLQPDEADDRFYNEIFTAYRRLIDTGVPLCPLRTLIEAVQIEDIVRGYIAQPYETYVEALKRLQRKHPRQVHFHVDRLGRPAYLKLDSHLLRM